MYKPFPAPHRVVCKSLLVCDNDEKKPKKKSAKTPRINVDKEKTVEVVNSVPSVPLIDERSHELGNNLAKRDSQKVEDVKDEVSTQQQMKLHQIVNNLNDLRGCSSKTSSIGALNSPPVEARNDLGSGKVHTGSLVRSDGKERKNLPIDKKSSPAKQVVSTDSLQAKPCTVKKYDKKETREYMKKKKLERQEKEQQELLQRRLELESRRKKLMELRDTTLKVLKASVKKRTQTNDEEELERNWRNVDDDENLEVPQLTLNTYSDMKNINGGPYSRSNFELNSLSLPKNNFPSKSKHLPFENTQQKVLDTKSKSKEVSSAKQHPSFSNHERVSASYSQVIPTKESSSMPNNSAITKKTQLPSQSNHLQSINEIDDKKEFILRLSDEVNRLSSSIKYLKENASKRLLETNKISSKSTDNFQNRMETAVCRRKPEVSKSCHSVPQEMVSAVSELKDTLTLLSQTSLRPASVGRVSNSIERNSVPALLPPPCNVSVGENHSGAFRSMKQSNFNEGNEKAEKLQSVYQRHKAHPKRHGLRSEECRNAISNGESDHSASSGFMFESNGASVKDSDSEDLSVQWLKMFALKPNPMNFITTLKSKLNLDNNKDSHTEKESKKLRMEKMFDALNEKFKENLDKSSEKSLSVGNNGERTEVTSPAIPSLEPLTQSELRLKLPSKLSKLDDHRKNNEYLLPKNSLQKIEDRIHTHIQEPSIDKRKVPAKLNIRKQESSKDLGLPVKEPNLISSQKPSDCVFLPLSIAHFPSADELKQSGNSSTRSSSTQPLTNNEKPLVIPELRLKSGLVSSTDLSSFHSKSNSEVSTQSKTDPLPASNRNLNSAPIRLRQVTAADKSSLSSMSDLSEQTIEKMEKFENKENELPKSLDVKSDGDLCKIYNPSALRLQAEAELNQIDLYTESLEQLVEVEHYRDLTLSKEAAGVQDWRHSNGKKDGSRNTSKSRKKSVLQSVSSTPSLTEITDTSIMSELLSLPNIELSRPSFSFEFSPNQAINKQSLQMLEQLLKDEEFWANHQKESLKLREKALLNSIKVGIVWFEVQKKQLKESGQEHLIKNLKKKQRGLLLKLQQEKEDIARLQKTILSASEERRLILMQQYQLVKSQLSAKDFSKRRKADSSSVKNVSSAKYLSTKPPESQIYKSADTEKIVCDKNLGQTLLEGLRALEQEKCKISEREKQLIEHSKNVDELLQWKKKFKDLEKQAGSSRPLRDRSTSPFRMTPEPITGISAPAGGDVETNHASQSMKKGQDDIQGNQCGDHHNAVLSSKGNLEAGGVRSVDHYGSESVESPESSETPRTHQSSCNVEMSNAMKSMSVHTKQTSIHIKTPLSPRLQNSRRLRYSSGSDDSMIFSQNETLSEQSETEVRVSALHEQLKQRKLEAERLQREHKRAQKERLKMKEQALIKQIQAYDEYIQKTRRELEQELSQAITPIVRPQIKQPRVAEKTVFKKQDNVPSSSTSESVDLTLRKVPVSDSQKVSPEKFLEPEDSHGLEVEPTEKAETRSVGEKELTHPESSEEQELFLPQIREDKVLEQEKSHVSENLTVKSSSEVSLIVPSLDLRSEGEEFQDEQSFSEREKGVTLEVLPSPELKSGQKIALVSSPENCSDVAKSFEEVRSDFVPSLELKSALQIGLVSSPKNDLEVAKSSEEIGSDIVKQSSPEFERSTSVEKQQSEAGSEILGSVSEISSLPTAQESDKTSAKQISGSAIDQIDQQVEENSQSREQSHKSGFISDIPAHEVAQSDVDTSSTIASISSHLDNSLLESNLKSVSPVKAVSEEIIVEKSRTISEKLSGEDNTEISSNYDQSVEKSVPEIRSNDNRVSEVNMCLSEHGPENVPSEIIHPVSPVFESSDLQGFSESILKTNEDWLDVDDFFESNFPSTNELKKSFEYNQGRAIQPSDNEKQLVETPKAETAVSEYMSAEISPKFDSAKSVEPVLELEVLSSVEPSEKEFSGRESDENSVKSDEDDDASSKCDSSVASKASVSSVRVSDSGKSYEKDRSLTEVVENCEVSELLDTSSTSNESCKTFDHDFDETKDMGDLFSNTFIVNEEKCASQPELTSNEVTDRITDAILNKLLQDSFDCIKPPKNGESEKLSLEAVSALETPFIEALKRDHEALKVKSQRAESSDTDGEVENRDKLYNAISMAETLLGVSLNDATNAVLQIRSNKITCDDRSKTFEESSQCKEPNTSGPKDDCSTPSNIKAAPARTANPPEKDAVGVGLGDDIDFNQDWLVDEECAQREAEKLRLKQLQIEQEIERLQQAQQQAPYIYERYLREIPNKPPPPYTPPVQPESVPTDENIVLNIVTSAASHIYDSRLIHVEAKPPPSFTSDKNNSLAIYKKFLYDLCLQLINDIYADDHNETAVPWEKTIKRKAKTKVPTNKAMLIEEIKQKVSILFGFRKKVAKENLIIRWSRKKRDHVDELLVREAQEEEQEWTNYEFDEVTVKNQVTMSLLNGLINNTAISLSTALRKKLEKLDKQ